MTTCHGRHSLLSPTTGIQRSYYLPDRVSHGLSTASETDRTWFGLTVSNAPRIVDARSFTAGMVVSEVRRGRSFAQLPISNQKPQNIANPNFLRRRSVQGSV
jgi:hypothetical protein